MSAPVQAGGEVAFAWIGAAAAGLTLASRLLGFFLVRPAAGAGTGRALGYLPLGLFAALIVGTVPGGDWRAWLAFVLGAVVTAAGVRRGRPVVVALVAGFAGAWMARALLTAILGRW